MADLPITGGGVAAVFANALAQPLGTQQQSWATQIATGYIGDGARCILKRGGSTVYNDTFTGSPVANADGSIVMPAVLSPPAATNVAADIHTGVWTCRIEKASDATRSITGTLGPPGSGADFILSIDLDGTTGMSVGSIVFNPPGGLDVGYVPPSTGVPIYSAQTTVEDMGLGNSFPAFGFGASWSTWPNPAFVAWGNRGIFEEQADWVRNQGGVPGGAWRYFNKWMVPYLGAAHNAINLRVRFEKQKFLGRRRSTGNWEAILTGNADSIFWFPASLGGAIAIPGQLDYRKVNGGSEVMIQNTPNVAENTRYVHHGMWTGHFFFDPTPFDALMHSALCTLVLDNPAGVDQRANARVGMAMGGDCFPTSAGYNGIKPANTPAWAHSRIKQLTSSPQWCTTANLSNARQDYVGPNASVSVQSFLDRPPPRALVEA